MKTRVVPSVVGDTTVIGASFMTRHTAREAYPKTAGNPPTGEPLAPRYPLA